MGAAQRDKHTDAAVGGAYGKISVIKSTNPSADECYVVLSKLC